MLVIFYSFPSAFLGLTSSAARDDSMFTGKLPSLKGAVTSLPTPTPSPTPAGTIN